MFDDVRCDYPLPEGAPAHGYQTKDTPAQGLETYTIAEDGRLLDQNGAAVPFHGDLTFYASNVSGTGPNGYITDNGRRAEMWEFVALYDEGRLLKLTGGRGAPEPFFDRDPLTREEFFRDFWEPARG